MRISAKAQLISRAAVPLDIHSTRLRAAVALTAALVYLLAYAPLHNVLGNSAGIFATVPVVIAGMLFGLSPNPPKDGLGDSP